MSAARLNVLEVLKLLPRTNCRECGVTTCFAFANDVSLAKRDPTDCPYIEDREIAVIRGHVPIAKDVDIESVDKDAEMLDELTMRVRQVDFDTVASRLGARIVDRGLAFQCLGKEFVVDERGRLRSQCHANFWVLVPLLDNIVRADAALGDQRNIVECAFDWVKVDELRNVMSSSDFFTTTFEASLCSMADRDSHLLGDVLRVFGGQHQDFGFGADLSVIVRPLPRVPLLLCYWKPDAEFESKLSLYFDRSAEEHLSVEGIYILVTGLVEMLKKLTARHSH